MKKAINVKAMHGPDGRSATNETHNPMIELIRPIVIVSITEDFNELLRKLEDNTGTMSIAETSIIPNNFTPVTRAIAVKTNKK